MMGLATLVLLVGLAGCRNNPVVPISDDNQLLQSEHGSILVASPDAPLPDVPCPVGFELIASRSTGRINPDGTRQVRHVYQGLADFAAAVEYYRDVLESHGWKSISQTAEGADTVLGYRSSRETLQVRLSKTGRILTVVVTLHPNGDAANL
jgi:hypothetical protein